MSKKPRKSPVEAELEAALKGTAPAVTVQQDEAVASTPATPNERPHPRPLLTANSYILKTFDGFIEPSIPANKPPVGSHTELCDEQDCTTHPGVNNGPFAGIKI